MLCIYYTALSQIPGFPVSTVVQLCAPLLTHCRYWSLPNLNWSSRPRSSLPSRVPMIRQAASLPSLRYPCLPFLSLVLDLWVICELCTGCYCPGQDVVRTVSLLMATLLMDRGVRSMQAAWLWPRNPSMWFISSQLSAQSSDHILPPPYTTY